MTVFDQEDIFNYDPALGEASLFELFLSDGKVSEEDGLVWKEILREGQWAYRPGPGQKPVPVPLNVVGGHSQSTNEIGMADLIDSFNDGAIDHVTVPTSHQDEPHENTGYVKKLRVVDKDGKAKLEAGIEFTEPEVKEKALRGSIAGISAGVMFDYIKKDTGKKFKQALGHAALTNKPWINGMKPFGVAASENFSDEEIIPLMLESVVWDQDKSYSWLRENVAAKLQGTVQGEVFVADISSNRALIEQFDVNSGNTNNFVVPFSVQDKDVEIAPQDKWIEASREWVQASETNVQDFNKDFGRKPDETDNDKSEELSESADKGANESDKDNEGGHLMADKKEPEQKGDSPSPAPDTKLSEDALKAVEDFRAEFAETEKAKDEENAKLRKELRGLTVDKRVSELKGLGLSEHPGFLKAVRNVFLADEGSTSLNFSETNGDEETEVKLGSVSEVVEYLLDALPKSDEGKYELVQHVSTDDHDKPPVEVENKKENFSTEGAAERADEFAADLELGEEYKSEKDGDQ